jgi:hypothetical protein
MKHQEFILPSPPQLPSCSSGNSIRGCIKTNFGERSPDKQSFFAFLIFQIPPEKVGATAVVRAPDAPALETCALSGPEKLIDQ